MAMSLADELAGFDDPPGDMSGGGLSLAEEFEMGLEYQDEPLMGDTPADRSAAVDEQNNRGLQNGSSVVGHQSLSSTIDDVDLRIIGGLPRPRQNPDGIDGYRTAKSSSSMMYGTASTSSMHDGMDVNAMLNTTFEDPDTSYDTGFGGLGLSSGSDAYHRSSPSHRDLRSNRQSGRSESIGFLGHRVDKDSMDVLRDILVFNQSFLEGLIHIDETSSLTTPTQTRTYKYDPIEVRLQRHLERLYEEDKRRDEQCRELALLAREVLGYRWDGEIEHEIATGRGLGLGMIDQVDDGAGDTGEEGHVGWDGDIKGKIARPHFAEMVGRPRLESPEIETLDPMSSLGSSADVSPIKVLSPLPTGSTQETGLSGLAPLPKTLRLLTSTTPDLINTFLNLSDTIHSTTSFSNSSSRNLRGIRAGIDSWKDRDNQEEQARRGIEEFERKRLEEGLRGEDSRESVRMVLEREVRGFEGALSGLQVRMDRLQRESAMRLVLR